MRTITALLGLFVGLSLPAADSGWTPLFDGKSTKGWTPRGEVTSFVAQNGELHLDCKKNVWVASDLKLADFIVELEVRLPKRKDSKFNSGLAFRCIGAEGKPKGYQAEIDARQPSQSGGVYGIGLGGWLYPKAAQKAEFSAKTKDLFKHEGWNKIRVKAVGSRIQTWVNDKPVTDVKDSQSLKGYFGIQHHGGGGVAKFRNLRVKNLAE